MNTHRTKHSLNVLALAFTICAAATSAVRADDRADFDRAYAAYQQHIDANDPAEALSAAKDAYGFGSKVFGRDSVNTANLAINYAKLLNDAGDFKKARRTLKGKEKVLEERYGESAPELVPIVIQLARAAKDPNTSLAHFERAARLSKGYENNLMEAQVNFDIVAILLRRGGAGLVEPYVDSAHAIYSDRLQPNDFRLGLMSYHKAMWANARNQHEEALGYLNGSLTAFKGSPGRPIGDLERTARAQLVETLEKLERPQDATQHCLVLGANQDWPATPEPVYRQAPEFPTEALEKQLEGEVTLSFTIDEQGFVVDPTVAESKHAVFNDAALAMVRKFRYAPRFIDGTPVATAGIEYTASFALAPAIATRSNPNFQRPPLRGFAQPDLFDRSECGEDLPENSAQCDDVRGGGK